MKNINKFLISWLGGIVPIAPIYIILHELGHSLVAISCGASITNFSITSAKISYTGGNFNRFTISLLNSGGMLLPVLVSLFLILIYNRNYNNMFYKCFYVLFLICIIFSVISWVIIPIIYMVSVPPSFDDCTKFLINSKLNPLIVIFIGVVIDAVLIFSSIKRGVYKSFFELCKKIK